MVAPCTPAELFAHVDDLSAYPPWMGLVHDVERVAARHGEDAAWDVELQAQVGPLTRSKRLRMVRTQLEPPELVVFERAEIDGREHAPWVLRAEIDAVEGPTSLTMTLSYGGGLWTGAVLGRVLDDEVQRGSERLRELVSGGPTR